MRRILVVDDSALVHAVVRQALRGLDDCQLSFVHNGREALASIDGDGEPDLILLDINMPVMDGLECLGELRARGLPQRVPVILVTTEGEPDDITRGLAAGARAYVKKPFRFDELRATVAGLLEANAP